VCTAAGHRKRLGPVTLVLITRTAHRRSSFLVHGGTRTRTYACTRGPRVSRQSVRHLASYRRELIFRISLSRRPASVFARRTGLRPAKRLWVNDVAEGDEAACRSGMQCRRYRIALTFGWPESKCFSETRRRVARKKTSRYFVGGIHSALLPLPASASKRNSIAALNKPFGPANGSRMSYIA